MGIDFNLILICKGFYVKDGSKLSTLDYLKRYHAIKCGYDYEYIDDGCLEFIANKLSRILIEIVYKDKTQDLFDVIHHEVSKNYLDNVKNKSHIECLIDIYISLIRWNEFKEILSGDIFELKETESFKKLFNELNS